MLEGEASEAWWPKGPAVWQKLVPVNFQTAQWEGDFSYASSPLVSSQ